MASAEQRRLPVVSDRTSVRSDPTMLERRSGHIINILSVAGKRCTRLGGIDGSATRCTVRYQVPNPGAVVYAGLLVVAPFVTGEKA